MIAKAEQTVRFLIESSGTNGYFKVLPVSGERVEGLGFWSLDLLLHEGDRSSSVDIRFPDTNTHLARFLDSTVSLTSGEANPQPIPMRLLFSKESGYVIRSDFLPQRLECLGHIRSVTSFLDPLQGITGVKPSEDLSIIIQTLPNALGAVILHSTAHLADLDNDLNNRLSYSWLSTTPLSPRRLAWVQGREDIDCIERAFNAAAALGIKLVILDEPGHWLQDPISPWVYLREAFIETDITTDENLFQRVIDAVRSYPHIIDGIVTISDVRLPAIARACRILGLPTEPAEAYDIAGDKGQTRLLERVGANESFVISSASELGPYLKQRKEPLRFPLVVKPVIGWCSDCVSKVHDTHELIAAVHKASERHAQSAKPSTTVVVEPYIAGPEVDANLAILDGEILFFDINDDFPSPADQTDADSRANFQETQNVIPSGLPQAELDAIRDQMRDSILRQGFRSGVFHCEARVRNSCVEYVVKDGVTDLSPKSLQIENNEPQVYLHEINARPPGYLETIAVLLAYGVDYYALRMLLAVGSSETNRLHALSQPFVQGAQFHLSLMIIQQTRAGIMKTADAAKEFLEKHPKLKDNIVDYYTRKKGGDILEGPDASALWWIAYFSVVSRHSRRDLLERVEFIQQNFEYEIEN
ncbi:hypothetical protein B0J11DRAFT_231173 [Dendryphion nanum]|uniref:ATP-grasp domain-containing protein n=1 Tax=Dendryphion nanum TaxID=256645 RepID=A0A9P9ITA8_9PLEO|nr:hypothetical protein B0J11DRAFT_231173 [Dendryphion nanum]